MSVLILYLAITFAGYFVGSRLRKKSEETEEKKEYRWTGKVQIVVIVLLVFTMGSRIGSDRSIIASLSTIGITSLILTVFAVGGSVLAVFLVRKWLGFNREGVRGDD